MHQEVFKLAQVLWDYMLVEHKITKSTAIFVLGSIDDRVATYGAQLFLNGLGEWLIVSGGAAHKDDLLATAWSEPTEAEHFAAIALRMGVPKEKIIIENKAQNTGDNIQLTQKLLANKGLAINSFILVQKPYMERRTYATFKKQWQGHTEFVVTSPPITFENYFNENQEFNDVVNIMVGDLQRIIEYPKLGYQIEQKVPKHVLVAYKELVNRGYTKHLLK